MLDPRLVEDVANRIRPGGEGAPADIDERLALMLERLGGDSLWADEYEEFVQNVSFAAQAEAITFTSALAAARRLVAAARAGPSLP